MKVISSSLKNIFLFGTLRFPLEKITYTIVISIALYVVWLPMHLKVSDTICAIIKNLRQFYKTRDLLSAVYASFLVLTSIAMAPTAQRPVPLFKCVRLLYISSANPGIRQCARNLIQNRDVRMTAREKRRRRAIEQEPRVPIPKNPCKNAASIFVHLFTASSST